MDPAGETSARNKGVWTAADEEMHGELDYAMLYVYLEDAGSLGDDMDQSQAEIAAVAGDRMYYSALEALSDCSRRVVDDGMAGNERFDRDPWCELSVYRLIQTSLLGQKRTTSKYKLTE